MAVFKTEIVKRWQRGKAMLCTSQLIIAYPVRKVVPDVAIDMKSPLIFPLTDNIIKLTFYLTKFAIFLLINSILELSIHLRSLVIL